MHRLSDTTGPDGGRSEPAATSSPLPSCPRCSRAPWRVRSSRCCRRSVCGKSSRSARVPARWRRRCSSISPREETSATASWSRAAALAARQHETISARVPDALASVSWLDALPEPGFRGVVLANEVVDALPVDRFEVTADGVLAHCVGFDRGGPVWRSRPAEPWLADAVESIQHEIGYRLPAGYVSEIGPARCAWIASVAERVERGLVLLMDYGFPRRELYHPDRRDGTLRCHFRHRRHDDPLVLCGLQDITATSTSPRSRAPPASTWRGSPPRVRSSSDADCSIWSPMSIRAAPNSSD